jgi:hypothetical protein
MQLFQPNTVAPLSSIPPQPGNPPQRPTGGSAPGSVGKPGRVTTVPRPVGINPVEVLNHHENVQAARIATRYVKQFLFENRLKSSQPKLGSINTFFAHSFIFP